MLDVQAVKVKKNFCKSLQNLNKREIRILGAYFQSQQLEINGLLLEKEKNMAILHGTGEDSGQIVSKFKFLFLFNITHERGEKGVMFHNV